MAKKSKGVSGQMEKINSVEKTEALPNHIEFARVMFLKGFEVGRVHGVHQLAMKLGLKEEEV